MVFYRKYRPQRIEELDLESVRQRLTAVLEKGDVPHAFLFTGPKGLGKTSSARILAKAINCTNRTSNKQQLTTNKKKSEVSSQKLDVDSIEPCNTCDICKVITNGSHIDVLEIDAASNRGIDEIRELRERIKYSPAELSKKIYIIDEVHMLTTEAFNALLKTLEEPPSHAVFILCTTEEWKIPPTISSRTFHVRFEKPSKEELLRSLQRIVEGEKLKIAKDALDRVYDLSDGAFRDAAKALEELAFESAGKEITFETVDKVFKLGSIEKNSAQLLTEIASQDQKNALAVIQQIAESGADFKVVHEQLVNLLHEELLILSRLKKEEPRFSLSLPDIKKLLELINVSYSQLRATVLPQLPLEIAVMDFFLGESKDALEVYPEQSRRVILSEAKNLVSKPKIEVIEKVVEKKTELEVSSVPEEKKERMDLNVEVTDTVTVTENSRDFLYKIIDSIKQDNQMLAAILRGCRAELSGSSLILTPTSKFHSEKIGDAKSRVTITDAASSILGQQVTIEIRG
jgi:DNA polymerase-3 subunit gamma/tau